MKVNMIHVFKKRAVPIKKTRWTLSLPQTSRANLVQCYSTHQDTHDSCFSENVAYVTWMYMKLLDIYNVVGIQKWLWYVSVRQKYLYISKSFIMLSDTYCSKETPPPGGFPIYYVPSSRTMCKRTPLEGFVPSFSRGVLLHTVLDQGT